MLKAMQGLCKVRFCSGMLQDVREQVNLGSWALFFSEGFMQLCCHVLPLMISHRSAMKVVTLLIYATLLHTEATCTLVLLKSGCQV